MSSTAPSRITASAASSVPIAHLGFSARLRALRDFAPVLNQKLSSSHTPQMTMRCGAPSGRVVAIQYCRLFFSRSAAHFQGSTSAVFAETSYSGTISVCALGSSRLSAGTFRAFVALRLITYLLRYAACGCRLPMHTSTLWPHQACQAFYLNGTTTGPETGSVTPRPPPRSSSVSRKESQPSYERRETPAHARA